MKRDDYSKALLETDIVELERYRAEKRRIKEMDQLRREVEMIKETIDTLSRVIIRLESKL